MKKHLLWILLGASLTIGACQGNHDAPAEPALQKTAEPAEISSPEVTVMNGPHANELQQQVEIAKLDLANRLGIPVDEISVLRAESVTWRDGSLGCPQKGMMYTQALVPGSLIVLSASGASHEYHSGRKGPPVYCARPQAPLESSSALQ
jgi:hypothetical protein